MTRKGHMNSNQKPAAARTEDTRPCAVGRRGVQGEREMGNISQTYADVLRFFSFIPVSGLRAAT